MSCRYCHGEKPLGKSHIIPESFMPRQEPGQKPPKLVTNTPGIHPKKSPIGVYDKTILCFECEKKFNIVDDYAKKLLIDSKSSFSEMRDNGLLVGFELLSYDYDKLKRFFVSLAWRASVSTHPFYSKINLGPYEDRALSLLKSDQAIPPTEFSVLLAKFDQNPGKSTLDPFFIKHDGVNYNQFYLESYIAYIHTDKLPPPETHTALMLNPEQPLRIVSRKFSGSKEFPIILDLSKRYNGLA